MNIIALSLGLAPIPPLPPAVRERQNRIADDRHRCTNVGRMTRQSATAYRAKLLQMLRDTGPATTSEVADYFGYSDFRVEFDCRTATRREHESQT